MLVVKSNNIFVKYYPRIHSSYQILQQIIVKDPLLQSLIILRLEVPLQVPHRLVIVLIDRDSIDTVQCLPTPIQAAPPRILLYQVVINDLTLTTRFSCPMTPLNTRTNMDKNFPIFFHHVPLQPVNFAEIPLILTPNALNVVTPSLPKNWLPIMEATEPAVYAISMAMVPLTAHGKILETILFLTNSRQ